MAHFYGTVQGNRGKTSRLGSARSGLSATAASWNGACTARVYVNDAGVDCVNVSLVKWRGSGIERVLYDGPINPNEVES